MDIGEGERLLIMILIGFVWGFASRHFITAPNREK